MVLIDTNSNTVLTVGKQVSAKLANFLAKHNPAQYQLGEEVKEAKVVAKEKPVEVEEKPDEAQPKQPESSISKPASAPKKRGRRPTKKS